MITELLKHSSVGVNEIKLNLLLSLLNENKVNPVIRSLMPPVEIGSITLVDQIVLLSLAKLISAKSVVEIGTYLGFTTALFAMNIPAKITSIDLPKQPLKNTGYTSERILTDGNYNDDYLRSEQNEKGEIYLNYLTSEDRKKITLIKADSTSLDFSKKFKCADLVFIDGGHEKSIVEMDTFNARSIVKKGVIIWHDFGSTIHDDVTKYLLEQRNRTIFNVRGSLCAFEIIN